LEGAVKLSRNSIPTNKFGGCNNCLRFGSQAEAYGNFLRELGINEMPVRIVDLQDKPFAMQMWFFRLGVGNRSGLLATTGPLQCPQARGVNGGVK